MGKAYTEGIDGNNCRLRHRIRRAVKKDRLFFKKRVYHWKAFEMAFFYINYDSI
jgi:IS1 family transposase